MGRLCSVIVVALMGLAACGRESDAEEPEVGEVQVANAEWKGFVQDMQRGLARIAPQVRGDSLESIRFFCAADESKRCPESSSAGRLGLRSGDYIVGVNELEFPAKGKRAGVVLSEQMRLSEGSCHISFTVKRGEELFTATAQCSDAESGS
jgi:hypothetical protein